MMLEELNTRIQKPELVEALVDFVVEQDYEGLSQASIEFAKIFLLDTLAVGIAGTTYDATDKALKAAQSWGETGTTRTIGRPGIKLARTSAAFINGIQTHALEWDGLHEPSVVIAMCAPVSAIMADLEHQQVCGKDLLLALIVAVEVAVFFGGESNSSPRFFRPSAAGVMGATMGLAKLRGLSKQQSIHALGLAYSQASGTMQAHWEGSMALPMQVGVAARTAHMSVDMVMAGMTGPVDIIDGHFGYFTLFEQGGDLPKLLSALGKPFKIEEMAHKPYPAGRATQAVLTMLNQIRRGHVFSVDDIEEIHVYLPPLVLLLVGRPATNDMTPSYARLCLRFIVPLMLIDEDIDPRRFVSATFSDENIVSLGKRMTIHHDGNPDTNALGPQRMQMLLKNGETLSADCAHPLGSPDNPLNERQRNDKVRRCFSLGLPDGNPQHLIDACEMLESTSDCSILLDIVSKTKGIKNPI